jgi:uncharacterized protein
MTGPGFTPPLEGRPLPELDHVSQHFWAGTVAGEVRYQECPACGHRQFYPRAMCTACAADTEWRVASGRGTVHTFTVLRQNLAPPWGQHLPYVVAMVELEEGVRMMTNITDCPPEAVSIGMAVEAYTVPVADDCALVFFRPAADQGSGA